MSTSSCQQSKQKAHGLKKINEILLLRPIKRLICRPLVTTILLLLKVNTPTTIKGRKLFKGGKLVAKIRYMEDERVAEGDASNPHDFCE